MPTDLPAERSIHTSTGDASDRAAAVALVVGVLAAAVTMALHPTGSDVVRNAAAGTSNALATGVHVLAMLAQPLLLAGTLALTRRLRARPDVATGAFIFYAFAGVAGVFAAATSGLVAPAVLRGLAEADPPTRDAMQRLHHYTGLLNQAFATLHVLFGGIAILLWSVAMRAVRSFSRALGAYGLVLGAALLLGIASGHLRLDVHGFGAVVLGEGVWLAWVAAHLWRGVDAGGTYDDARASASRGERQA